MCLGYVKKIKSKFEIHTKKQKWQIRTWIVSFWFCLSVTLFTLKLSFFVPDMYFEFWFEPFTDRSTEAAASEHACGHWPDGRGGRESNEREAGSVLWRGVRWNFPSSIYTTPTPAPPSAPLNAAVSARAPNSPNCPSAALPVTPLFITASSRENKMASSNNCLPLVIGVLCVLKNKIKNGVLW